MKIATQAMSLSFRSRGVEDAWYVSIMNVNIINQARGPPRAEVYYRSHTSCKLSHFTLNKLQTAVAFSLTPRPPQPRDNFLTVNLQINTNVPANRTLKLLAKTAKLPEFNTFSLLEQYRSQLKVRSRASFVNKIDISC